MVLYYISCPYQLYLCHFLLSSLSDMVYDWVHWGLCVWVSFSSPGSSVGMNHWPLNGCAGTSTGPWSRPKTSRTWCTWKRCMTSWTSTCGSGVHPSQHSSMILTLSWSVVMFVFMYLADTIVTKKVMTVMTILHCLNQKMSSSRDAVCRQNGWLQKKSHILTKEILHPIWNRCSSTFLLAAICNFTPPFVTAVPLHFSCQLPLHGHVPWRQPGAWGAEGAGHHHSRGRSQHHSPHPSLRVTGQARCSPWHRHKRLPQPDHRLQRPRSQGPEPGRPVRKSWQLPGVQAGSGWTAHTRAATATAEGVVQKAEPRWRHGKDFYGKRDKRKEDQ